MTVLSRRIVLSGLLAISSAPVAAWGAEDEAGQAADPFAGRLNMDAVKSIASSYETATGDDVGEDVAAILFPGGQADADVLKTRAAQDFAEGRLFVHEGWRLSHTEGQLFTLLARSG